MRVAPPCFFGKHILFAAGEMQYAGPFLLQAEQHFWCCFSQQAIHFDAPLTLLLGMFLLYRVVEYFFNSRLMQVSYA